ncbi:hypothetical protein [Nocardioides sp.]|uniref:hypothetical protein n=1 Tax=Nocardioides sp. TaxID=35761 RepID=UPI00351769B2
MIDVLTWAVLALGAVTLVVLGVAIVRDEEPQDRTFALLAAYEVLLLVQLVVGCVRLAGLERDIEGTVFVSYLVTVALALPVGAFLTLAERTRWGTVLLGVAVLTVMGLELRLDQVWNA